MQRIYGFLIFLGLALLFGMMVRSFPCEKSFVVGAAPQQMDC